MLSDIDILSKWLSHQYSKCACPTKGSIREYKTKRIFIKEIESMIKCFKTDKPMTEVWLKIMENEEERQNIMLSMKEEGRV